MRYILDKDFTICDVIIFFLIWDHFNLANFENILTSESSEKIKHALGYLIAEDRIELADNGFYRLQ